MQHVYELMVILRPDFGVEEKAVKEAVMKLLSGHDIQELSILGKKRLAYPIGKHSEGVYAVAKVAGKAIPVVDLEKQMKLTGDVVRYLLTAKE